MSEQLPPTIQLVTIPQIISHYQTKQNLSLRCMAEQLGISAAALSNWMRFVADPDPDTLLQILWTRPGWPSEMAQRLLDLRMSRKNNKPCEEAENG